VPASYTRTPPTALGRLLRESREAQSLELHELGARAGIGGSTIQKWENGRVKEPPIRGVLRYARVLGIPDAAVIAAALAEPPAATRAAQQDAAAARRGTMEGMEVSVQRRRGRVARSRPRSRDLPT
jgi:transcriptional regulator with XRE-family HTH domain